MPKTRKGVPKGTRMPQPHGGVLVSGAGGGPQPGSGRPPEAFRAFLSRMRKDPKIQAALERALRDPESRGFASALKVLAEYDPEKPGQKVEMAHSGGLVVTIRREGKRIPRPAPKSDRGT